MLVALLLAAIAAIALLPGAASAATRCAEPQATGPSGWERVSPQDAGMNGARLEAALDYGTANLGFALRVYRRGCLVASDRLAAVNQDLRFESWSLAKSVTALLFGRAMTLGLVSPDDPVGSLVPRAGREHGSITLGELLTMTSGLRWNGLRDYNIFTMPDRVRDALTLDIVHEPGSYYEYSQSGVSLLVEAIRRATGADPVAFIQRELFDRIGIPRSQWNWNRDPRGQVVGFMGVQMRPDDYGRLGELMRRDGRWRGERLLSRRFMHQALRPSARNGCYGWLIWLNASGPCIGPTITDRPETNRRQFPGLPHDMYRFSGLLGQIVTVFPSQELVVVRTGVDTLLSFSGGEGWERELYRRILLAITDDPVDPSDEPPAAGPDPPNADYGFQTALLEPDQYLKGVVQDPWPPTGPPRTRAAIVPDQSRPVRRDGSVRIAIECPPQFPGAPAVRRCDGRARLAGARRPAGYRIAGGRRALIALELRPALARRAGAARTLTRELTARNRDGAGGATTTERIHLHARG